VAPERDATIERICQAALDCEPSARTMFVHDACGGDAALEQRVIALLTHATEAERFLEMPARVSLTDAEPSRLSKGQRIGPYEIIETIGAGGMGDVYRARDTRLGRVVAIKTLSSLLRDDPELRRRFEREARTLAALSHPHICPVFDVGWEGDIDFLVMEHIEGETLADRLSKGALADRDALQIAAQIADALETAHEKGIIHRDLKPANVMITSGEIVKVLDFGLAKTLGHTNEMTATRAGVIVGTVAYMSPEQARGRTVDKRTDIWAFGCLLFEMLTGSPAFSGEALADTLVAIVEREPDWRLLPADAPRAVDRLLRRCLEKDARRRLRDIGDARIEIDEALSESHREASERHISTDRIFLRERRVLRSALAVVAAIAAGLAIEALRPGPQPPEMRFEITTPPTTSLSGPLSQFAISPDGESLAFIATSDDRSKLWVRKLDSTTARPLAGTDFASALFWSPDSRSIAFFTLTQLKRIDVSGGNVQTIATSRALVPSGAWSRNGTILYTADVGGPLYRVSAAGGEPVPVTPPTSAGALPAFISDGRRFLYFDANASPNIRGFYIADLGSPTVRRLIDADQAVLHAPSGELLFIRQGTLFAQAFDPGQLVLKGNARALTTPSDGTVIAVSASDAGPIAFRSGTGSGLRQLAWFDRSGTELEKVGDAMDVLSPSMSLDGRYVAETVVRDRRTDVWLLELNRRVFSRLTLTDDRDEVNPIWAPDGRRLVFLSRGETSAADLFQKTVTGAGAEEPLLVSEQDKSPSDWSQDGRFLLYEDSEAKSAGRKWGDIWALPMDGHGRPFPVVHTSAQEAHAQFSPDAKWIAFESNESGRNEIYLQRFPGPGPRTPVSTNGGAQVRWRQDGKELFYVAPEGRLMAVPIQLPPNGESVNIGSPVPLFVMHTLRTAAESPLPAQYVVDGDGQRFLVMNVVPENRPITVVLSWKGRR
jgi:eukaryotic-like serine/threonine-protein kinase